jgi:DegV family protein with EDD domain
MNDYLLVMDASADINADFRIAHDIRIIPMDFTIGNEFKKSNGRESDEILHTLYEGQRHDDLTKTTQITPFIYKEFFQKLISEEKKPIMYFSLSSGLSNTYQSAELASQELKEEYPDYPIVCIDTLAATGGIGVELQQAVRNKEQGMSLEENAKDINQKKLFIRHWFMVEDLHYLARGGRISGTAAAIGSFLNFKPVLRIAPNGKLETIDKKRGRKQALLALVELFNEHFNPELTKDVYITHSDCLSSAEFVRDEILLTHPGLNIEITYLCPIIGAHTGPDIVTVCYFGK